jgi:hypothetical protein
MELEGVSAADPKVGCDFSMGFRPLGISLNRPKANCTKIQAENCTTVRC